MAEVAVSDSGWLWGWCLVCRQRPGAPECVAVCGSASRAYRGPLVHGQAGGLVLALQC